MKRLIRQAFRFGIVGMIAMATHFALVLIIVSLNIHPLVANIIAFIGAFQVSYWGHSHWSFSDSTACRIQSLKRFSIVAVGGFLINEALFASLLTWTLLPYQLSLFIVLALVAGISFLLSRHWAFAH